MKKRINELAITELSQIFYAIKFNSPVPHCYYHYIVHTFNHISFHTARLPKYSSIGGETPPSFDFYQIKCPSSTNE